jgi:hypothetical protein
MMKKLDIVDCEKDGVFASCKVCGSTINKTK